MKFPKPKVCYPNGNIALVENSIKNDIVPKLVREPLLEIRQRPALLVPDILQLRFEEWNLVLVRCILQVFLNWRPVYLQTLPVFTVSRECDWKPVPKRTILWPNEAARSI